MAKLTLQIVGQTNAPGNGIDVVIQRIKTEFKQLESTPVKIKIETEGDVKALQAEARLENAKAKRIAAENRLKIAQEQTKQSEQAANREKEKTIQIEKQATLEIRRRETEEQKRKTAIKQGETAEKQAALATEKATEAEKKRALSVQQAKTAIEQRRLQEEKTKTATEQHATADAKAAAAADKRAAAEARATTQTKQLGTATQTTAQHTETLWNKITKFGSWYLIGGAFSAVIGSFREAVQTLKDVDTQLTNIQKVSNLSSDAVARIGDRAYESAQKFGVSVKEYLEAVYTFQKAGLGESSEDMAELATKTMLVGDTTAEVATKFLVATNAAWEMNASMEALSKAIDETDWVNNNLATSLDKMADSMPIVASTAASMNMSFEETLALLATINSKTQETGRKTATAVRSFLIAISGQVGEFVDDVGETYEVTTENIEALTDALAKYGSAAVKHAVETGEIINPMDALNSLAQAYKDNLLTDIELQEILIKVAGKMRYNSLVTIVKDLASETSTYRDTLSQLSDAAGTADKEVSVMMDSWEKKSQNLKTAFAELFSHLIKTDAVKDAIDGLTVAVKVLDTGVGRAVISVAALSAALLAASIAYGKLKASIAKSSVINGVITLIEMTIAAIQGLTTVTEIFSTVWDTSPLVIVTVIAAAVYGLIKGIDALIITTEEYVEKAQSHSEKAKELKADIESLNETIRENQELIESSDEAANNTAFIIRLEKENELLEAQIELLEAREKKEREKAQRDALAGLQKKDYRVGTGEYRTVTEKEDFGETITYEEEIFESGDIVQYTEYLLRLAKGGADVTVQLSDAVSTLLAFQDSLDVSTTAGKFWSDIIDRLILEAGNYAKQVNAASTETEGAAKAVDGATESVKRYANAEKIASSVQLALNAESVKGVEAYNRLKSHLDPLINAYNELAENGVMTEATWKALIEAYPDLEVGLDGTTASGEAFDQVLEEMISLILQGKGVTIDFSKGLDATSDSTATAAVRSRAYSDAVYTTAEAADTLTKVLKLTDTALEEIKKSGTLSVDTLKSLDAIFPGLSAHLVDVNGKLTAEGKAALSSKAAFIELMGAEIAFNNTTLDVSGKLAALQSLARQAGVTGAAIALAVGVADITSAADAYVTELGYSRDAANEAALQDYYNYNWKPAVESAEDTDTAVGGGGGGGGNNEDKELARRKQVLADEKAKYDLMEAQGASAAELVAQAIKVQDALHDQAERMRELGAAESEVLAVSKEWWDWEDKKNKLLEEEQKKIEDAQKAKLEEKEKTVESLKSELAFLEASGASEEDRIAKMREIQNALHEQAEYMREIEADEDDIRKLSTEWWNIENDILDITEQIAQKLKDDIAETLEGIVDTLKDAEEAAVKPLQEELDALEAAHKATEERREEEEKILAVEQARIALENAQRERTVRQYNAATGQWEWVADAKKVEDAQKALIDAEADLQKYRDDQAYKLRREELEKEIENTKSAFDSLRDAIETAAKAIRDGDMTFEQAYSYIRGKMHDIYDEYDVDLSGVMDDVTETLEKQFGKPLKALGDMEDEIRKAIKEIQEKSDDPAKAIDEFARAIYAALETDDPEAAIAALVKRIMDGADSFNDIDKLLADVNDETNRLLLIAKMQSNSVEWKTASAERRSELHDENVRIGTALGWDYDPASGLWYTDKTHSQVAYTTGELSGDEMYGEDFFTHLATVIANALYGGTGTEDAAGEKAGGRKKVGGGNGTSTFTEHNAKGRDEDDGGGGGEDVAVKPFYGPSTGEVYKSTPDYSVITSRVLDNVRNGYMTPEEGAEIIKGNSEALGTHVWDNVIDALENGTYDSGGILHGIGGIKATRQDEMILPPDTTGALLKAERNGGFDALLRSLGIVTAAANGISAFGSVNARESIGSQHNGDIYEIDGVTMTEGQARSMTIYDLAQMGKTLALHRGS